MVVRFGLYGLEVRRGHVSSGSSSLASFGTVAGDDTALASLIVSVCVGEEGFFLLLLCGELFLLEDGVDFLLRRLGLTSCHWPSRSSCLGGLCWLLMEFSASRKNITSSYSISDASHRSGSCSFKYGMVVSVMRLRRVELTFNPWSLR